MAFLNEPFITPFQTPQPDFLNERAAEEARIAEATFGSEYVATALRDGGASDWQRQQTAHDLHQRAMYAQTIQQVQGAGFATAPLPAPSVAPTPITTTTTTTDEWSAQKPALKSAATKRRTLGSAHQLDAAASKNLESAVLSFLGWFVVFIGALGSIACLYRSFSIRAEAKKLGARNPPANVQAMLVSIAPFIVFPTAAILISLFVGGN